MSEDLYTRARVLLQQSRRAVALTGAGISTPSGIPDFRSPGTGMWSQVDPMEVATIQVFRRDPAAFYRWYGASARQMFAVQPNPAHLALAELERRGTLRAVVTQNIDRLHQQAGSLRVLELHGNCQTAHCLRCGAAFEARPLLERFLETEEVPHCPCGGLIKPDVVLFGEMLPLDVLEEARQEIAHCDLLLIVGSSLVVTPAAELPWLAIQARAPLILCNREATWADPYAAVILRDDVARSLPALLEGW